MPEQPLKTVSLHFAIPAGIDTPSETLLKMRSLLLGALEAEFQHDTRFSLSLTDEERALCKALLTES